MSWVSSTENADWPPSDFISPFSFRVCSTIAVDDSASTRPDRERRRWPWLAEQQAPAMATASAVSPTCSAAEPDQLGAHLPQPLRLQLQPDQEQHHHHAELGEMLDLHHVDMQQRQHRRDDDAGDQVAQHRAEARAARRSAPRSPRRPGR